MWSLQEFESFWALSSENWRGKGQDDWSLLVEEAPLMNGVKAINQLRVEQYAGAQGIRDLMIRSEPWSPGEEPPRSHPRAKKERTVGPNQGVKFQALRSTWGIPGQHVPVSRIPDFHHAFPDVAAAGPDRLIAAWANKSHSGGTGGFSVADSDDRGQTWGESRLVHPGRANCPRIQRLNDGTLLVLCDVRQKRQGQDYNDVVLYDSKDRGKTWDNQRWIRAPRPGSAGLLVPSRVTELADGSWLITSSGYSGTPFHPTAEQLDIYRSTDRGLTWKPHSEIHAHPPHNLSEATILVLPDGRLLLYAREWRYDGLPGVKAYSKDNGKTWQLQELPFSAYQVHHSSQVV